MWRVPCWEHVFGWFNMFLTKARSFWNFQILVGLFVNMEWQVATDFNLLLQNPWNDLPWPALKSEAFSWESRVANSQKLWWTSRLLWELMVPHRFLWDFPSSWSWGPQEFLRFEFLFQVATGKYQQWESWLNPTWPGDVCVTRLPKPQMLENLMVNLTSEAQCWWTIVAYTEVWDEIPSCLVTLRKRWVMKKKGPLVV